jgi:hypothetical protein
MNARRRSEEAENLFGDTSPSKHLRPIELCEVWTWQGLEAKRCSRCGCTPDAPCTVALEEGCGEGACVPAGVYDATLCSRCTP